MREVSAHDMLKMVFCANCEVREVNVEGEICEACKRFGFAFAGGDSRSIFVRADKVIKLHDKPKQKAEAVMVYSGLKCKAEGCDQDVPTHKGTAGWCIKLQDNGKTHRQMMLEEKRKTNPNYGIRHGDRTVIDGGGGQSRGSGLPQITFPRREVEKPVGITWLEDVKETINAALGEVAIAEDNLEEAKKKLRIILAEAQETLE